MRGLWLLLAGCAADREPPPPIPDGIYKVVSAPLPSDDAGVRDAAVFFVNGVPYNHMSKALMALSSAELYPTATIDGVELALSNDVLTVVHRGVMDTPTPLQYEDGVVTAGGATIDATVAIPGADPVRVDLIDATVRFDPTTLHGAIGGIVPTAQKVERLYPIVVTALNKQVAKDCKRLDDPTHHCGCRDGSNGSRSSTS